MEERVKVIRGPGLKVEGGPWGGIGLLGVYFQILLIENVKFLRLCRIFTVFLHEKPFWFKIGMLSL